MLKPPLHIEQIDWPASVMWFDDDGVLYSIPKSNAPKPKSKEETLVEMEESRKLVGGKKTA